MTSDCNASEKSFRVSLEKEQLIFSAAHFITFDGDVCESLHGHNYRLRADVEGPLDENGYVVDFVALRDYLFSIVKELDHRVLLPRHHPKIKVGITSGEVIVTYEDKRWVFPVDNCCLLPIENTTAELIAEWVAERLIEDFLSKNDAKWQHLEIGIDENEGQWATCILKNSSP